MFSGVVTPSRDGVVLVEKIKSSYNQFLPYSFFDNEHERATTLASFEFPKKQLIKFMLLWPIAGE